MAETLTKEEAIFHAALQIEAAGQRTAYLDVACANQDELRRRVEALLGRCAESVGPLDRPACSHAATANECVAERPGTVIGRYKLLEQIGEGGMGLVFVAEQEQPVSRRVALKVIKPGMDSRQVVARFEAERQALALMDHANIAKIHDGGATPEGRPYFVMELVRGLPITKHCDTHRFSPRQRLELFLDVCHAVQHAHHKGIIHRDLKPSNVLVAVHDITPVVKVIDFGIAKATGLQLTDRTVYTGFAQMVGTPQYMSPEQAGLSALDVDTRSDIYSLGVLLYELLTGTTPFESETLRQAGYDEIRRIIREDEPPRPSTRISTLGQAAVTVSTQRQSDPKRLSQQFRGELDLIVMKALEKDRNRRYESASALAADVQRHLNDEPVQACPPSAAYRLKKLARRHKVALAVAAGVLVLVVVLLLGGAVLWNQQQEQQQQQAALEGQRVALEQAVGEDLREADLLQQQERWSDVLRVLARASGRLAAGGSPPLRERLELRRKQVTMVARLEEACLRRSGVGPGGHDNAGTDQAYAAAFASFGLNLETLDPAEAVERIRMSPIRKQLVVALDDWTVVKNHVRDASGEPLRAVAQLADDDPWRQQLRDPKVRKDPAALAKLAAAEGVLDQPPVNLWLLSGALNRTKETAATVRLLRRTQRRYPADFWSNRSLGEYLAEGNAAALAEAIGFYRAALALRPQSDVVYNNLGFALHKQGKQFEAMEAWRKAIEFNPACTLAYTNLGSALRGQGKLSEATAVFLKAIDSDPRYAVAHWLLSAALAAKRDFDGAMTAFRKAIDIDPIYADAHYGLGNALAAKHDLDRAIVAYRKAIDCDPKNADVHANLGNALLATNDLDGAIAAYCQAIDIHPKHAIAHNNLGNALAAKKDMEAAIVEYKKAIDSDPKFAKPYFNLGLALRIKRDLDGAIAAFRQAIDLDPRYAQAHNSLGAALAAKQDLDGAIAAYRKAIACDPKYAYARHNFGVTLAAKGDVEGMKRLYVSAVRFYQEAFAVSPDLVASPEKGIRYNAACAAALAGCGQGKDVDPLDAQEGARLRKQTLDWLRADLAAWRNLLEKNKDKAAPVVAQTMQHWLGDTDFNGVRGAAALAKLPEAERGDWQRLWEEVAALRQQAQAKEK